MRRTSRRSRIIPASTASKIIHQRMLSATSPALSTTAVVTYAQKYFFYYFRNYCIFIVIYCCYYFFLKKTQHKSGYDRQSVQSAAGKLSCNITALKRCSKTEILLNKKLVSLASPVLIEILFPRLAIGAGELMR